MTILRSPTTPLAQTQVAIIGGGSAGACCALALRQQGIEDVTLIEASRFDRYRIGESIPPESKQLLLKLGVWQAFQQQSHIPCYGSRSWWGDSRPGFNDNLLNPYGHGWHIDRAKFNAFLFEQARQVNTTILSPYYFRDVSETATGQHRLLLSYDHNQYYLDADFVVDASGAMARFARTQGSHKLYASAQLCSSRLYQLQQGQATLSGVTHLEAVASGWWYAARLPANRLLISHTTDLETFKTLRLNQTQQWHNELLRSTHTRQLIEGIATCENKLRICAAPSFVLDRVIGRNWLAIGDAAASFDPITAQGIIKSISDAIFTAPRIAQYLREQNTEALNPYQLLVQQRHQQYSEMRSYLYRQENRFKGHNYWDIMRGTSETPGLNVSRQRLVAI